MRVHGEQVPAVVPERGGPTAHCPFHLRHVRGLSLALFGLRRKIADRVRTSTAIRNSSRSSLPLSRRASSRLRLKISCVTAVSYAPSLDELTQEFSTGYLVIARRPAHLNKGDTRLLVLPPPPALLPLPEDHQFPLSSWPGRTRVVLSSPRVPFSTLSLSLAPYCTSFPRQTLSRSLRFRLSHMILSRKTLLDYTLCNHI